MQHEDVHPRFGTVARWILLPALLLVGLALPYILINDEPDQMDQAAREATGGQFVQLSAGYTHYEMAGPADAQVVVLVHGTSTPLFVWDKNFTVLANAGLRVVRYDLFGRGLSDRPEVRYDLDLHVGQLVELVDRVAQNGAVDLVGLSIGGVIVAEFARRYPARVRKLALIAPAGIGTNLPLVARIGTAPGVGEYIMRVAGTRQLIPSKRSLLHPERHPEFDSVYLKTIRFQGSRRAILGSLRNLPFNSFESGYRAVGELRKSILLIWGVQDTIVPFSGSERMRQVLQPARFEAVQDAGHLPHYERPGVVNPVLTEFLVRGVNDGKAGAQPALPADGPRAARSARR